MHSDSDGLYRKKLLSSTLLRLDRVDDPWAVVPDLPEFNRRAFQRVLLAIRQLKLDGEQQPAPSTGVLVSGGYGTGKTHLLMRIVQQVSQHVPVVFVPRPLEEDRVIMHTWLELLSSLQMPIPGDEHGRTQLDNLLARVFSHVLIEQWEYEIETNQEKGDDKKRRIAALRRDPFTFFRWENNHDWLEQKTLKFLQRRFPRVNHEIVEALFKYCLVRTDRSKRDVIAWLEGRQLDDSQLKLPDSWAAEDESRLPRELRELRERGALKAIQTIGILSTVHNPIVLAYDQLEGLRGNHALTERWGDAVQEIISATPNLIVVSCMLDDLWETWFEPNLIGSNVTRIASRRIALDPFTPADARPLLARHLHEANQHHNLPTPLFPFEDADLEQLCQPPCTPRTLLQRAKNMYEDWLVDDGLGQLGEGLGADQLFVEQLFGESASDAAPPESAPPAEILAREEQAVSNDVEALSPEEKPAPTEAADATDTRTAEVCSEPPSRAKETNEAVPTRAAEQTDRVQQVAKKLQRDLSNAELRFRGQYNYSDPLPAAELLSTVRIVIQKLAQFADCPLTVWEDEDFPLDAVFLRVGEDAPAVGVAICEDIGATLAGRLTRLERFQDSVQPQPRIVVLRDARTRVPYHAAGIRLREFGARHGSYRLVGHEDFVLLRALRAELISYEEGDVTLPDGPISAAEFLEALGALQLVHNSDVIRSVCRECPDLAAALRTVDAGPDGRQQAVHLLEANERRSKRMSEPSKRPLVDLGRPKQATAQNGKVEFRFGKIPPRVAQQLSARPYFHFKNVLAEGRVERRNKRNKPEVIATATFKTRTKDKQPIRLDPEETHLKLAYDQRDDLSASHAFLSAYAAAPNPILEALASPQSNGGLQDRMGYADLLDIAKLVEENSGDQLSEHEVEYVLRALRQRVSIVLSHGAPELRYRMLGVLIACLLNFEKRVLLATTNLLETADVLAEVNRLVQDFERPPTTAHFGPHGFEVEDVNRDSFPNLNWSTLDEVRSCHLVVADLQALINMTTPTRKKRRNTGLFDHVVCDGLAPGDGPLVAMASYLATSSLVIGSDASLVSGESGGADDADAWYERHVADVLLNGDFQSDSRVISV